MAWNVWDLTSNRWMLMKSVGSAELAAKAIEELFKRNYPDREFEARRVRPVLEQHGTALMKLKPHMIWDIAMQDLERRERNKAHGPTDIGSYEQYASHRNHVAGANTANDIIRAAIADRALGLASDKADTRLIYSDLETLKAALQ